MKMKTYLTLAALLAVATGVQAGIINGQTLKLNFTNGWHPGDYGDVSTKGGWNYYPWLDGNNATTGNFTDMIDDTDALVSGVSLTAGGWGGGNYNDGNVWPSENINNTDGVYWDQYVNFWWAFDSSTEAITVHGLDDNLTYNVRLYALLPLDPGTGADTEITLNGNMIDGGLQGDRWHSAEATTPFNWSGVSSAGGNLAFSWNATGPDNPVLNAIVIEAIPEPATFGLFALFGGGIAFIRKRRII